MAPTATTRRHGPQGVDASAFQSLISEWDTLAPSRRYRRRLTGWAGLEPVLDYPSGIALITAAMESDDITRCRILEVLCRIAPTDELAMRTVIQVLLPRLVCLVNRSHHSGIDMAERAATLVVIATEIVISSPPDTAGTVYDFRLWCNIRKRYTRWLCAQQRRLESQVLPESVDDYAEYHDALRHSPSEMSEAHELEELCAWVAERAQLDLGTARLVVLTRAGGVPLEALLTGHSQDTIRHRRNRAEKKLRASLAA